jgi:hypothetical protein
MRTRLPAACLRELVASAERFEAAFRRRAEAGRPALDYRRARSALWRASDDLAIKLRAAGEKSLWRGSVLYVLTDGMHDPRRDVVRPPGAMSDDEMIRSLVPGTRVERIDLGAGSDRAACGGG